MEEDRRRGGGNVRGLRGEVMEGMGEREAEASGTKVRARPYTPFLETLLFPHYLRFPHGNPCVSSQSFLPCCLSPISALSLRSRLPLLGPRDRKDLGRRMAAATPHRKVRRPRAILRKAEARREARAPATSQQRLRTVCIQGAAGRKARFLRKRHPRGDPRADRLI